MEENSWVQQTDVTTNWRTILLSWRAEVVAVTNENASADGQDVSLESRDVQNGSTGNGSKEGLEHQQLG